MSGTRPRWAKFQAKRARLETMRTSHWLVNSAPMPTANPSMAPITGTGHCTRGHHLLTSSCVPRTPRVSPGTVARSARSVPAQNVPPEPVTISTRTRSSAPISATLPVKAASMA